MKKDLPVFVISADAIAELAAGRSVLLMVHGQGVVLCAEQSFWAEGLPLGYSRARERIAPTDQAAGEKPLVSEPNSLARAAIHAGQAAARNPDCPRLSCRLMSLCLHPTECPADPADDLPKHQVDNDQQSENPS